MDVLSKKMNAIVDVLDDQGIEEKNIRTQNLSLRPSYDYDEGRRIDRGFEASQNLSVKIRDLEKISSVIGAVVSKGSNQIGGVNFTIDDPEFLRENAREKAIEKAREKAKVLASQLGMSLGKVKGYSEGGGIPPPTIPMMRSMAVNIEKKVDELSLPPVPTGEQEILVQVTIKYELQ